jgi:hypothetical protein
MHNNNNDNSQHALIVFREMMMAGAAGCVRADHKQALRSHHHNTLMLS